PDSSWAKVGDSVFVTFTASETLDNISITIAGVSSSYNELSGAKYQGYHVMDESNDEGDIPFLITYTDLGGAIGPDADTTTNNTNVQFDKTVPEFSLIRMGTNNVYGDSLAGIGSVDTLSFTISENQRDLNVELAGTEKTPEQEELNFITTHTFSESDEDGWVSFTLSMTDSAGNPSDTLITTQDGSQVRFDGTFPLLPIVNFFSNNSNDSSLCIPGDSLFLQYTSSETLRTATITLAGNSPDESGWLGGFNYASYVLTGTEDEGFIPFTMGFEDWVGNPGDTISGTTNGSSVLFDMTPPDDFTLGDVVSKNGIEVAGHWNASNQTLEIVIPVPNDETLPDGGIQFQASFGGSYSNLADTVDIDQSDLGMEKIVSISETDFESIADFTENGNATFQAVLWDKAGNSTIGSASTSTIHIDQTLPILDIVSQRTNNAVADSLAKVGDTDSLIVSSTEGLDSIQVWIFNQNAVHSGANRDWTFTHSFQETDNDDMVSFNIVFGDTAGNFGTDVSTTTDGSTVRFDGTKPTLTSVSFSSTNVIDGGLAIPADTLYLDFISDEDLLTKEVLIAGFDADTTFENISRTPFRSWRIMDGTEEEGYIEFEIGYSDLVGNIGDTINETTNGTSILFDMTPPDDFELDTVFVSGGKVIYGFWNASNDTLTLRVPIPEDDETLIGGTFQPQVRFGEGTYVNLGDEKTIIGGQGVSSQDLIITRMEFTTVDGFSENLNGQFIAKAKDRAGNETVGSTDNTTLHIDEIVPSLTEVLIQSNNELDSTWAKISDIVSLNFTASEGLSFVTPVLFSDSLTGVSENAGSSWTVTKTILSDNAEGIIPFFITYNDTAGNEGDQVSSSTDGRSVTLDKTNPRITNLLEGNEGLDINYYNQADSITLYWSQFDSLAGVKDAYVGLGTDSNLTDVLDWTLSNQGSVAGLGGLSLSNDGIYFGAVFVRDSAGNHSDSLWGNSIYIDTQNPDTGSVIDAYWVMDLDYAIDSTRLSYIWSNFTDNTEIDYFEIAIGTEDDTANVMNWMRSDSTDSMTVTGLNLVRDTLYYSYIRAFDMATNKSLAARTDGIYFDDSYPIVNKITPNVISDSAGFLSVLANDTLTIKFNRPIYEYGLSVNSNVDSNLTISHEYGDSIITVIWTDTLASYDTLTVILDSAVAYNTLWLTDTLYFYSKLWADLNNDYDITIEDILTFNQNWPETDLGPFKDDPPHVRPEPDGEANLTDLAAFGKMWHWKYFNLEFDTTLIAARSTDGLKIIAQGSKANITIPKNVAMAEILIGKSNLDIEKMHFVNPSGSAFMFTSSDTAHGLIQFSMADHRGFDSTLTLIIPETEQEYFQAQIQYKFMDITGVNLADGIASVDVEILPDKFMVYNNYPNPFNPITVINYDLPEVRDVNIIIYDLLGRTIRHLDLNKVKAGRHKFVWHGTNDFGKRASTGIYFLQITAGQDIQTQKMLLLK
ncbi:MAG: T9SS type A sorting domain-containing protein, partial [Candidatus Marinimicrobia bacterium]|nr:T9SS type A sorting domain-containing protein [Candidatus Neomarinimicrobiota bacterium]